MTRHAALAVAAAGRRPWPPSRAHPSRSAAGTCAASQARNEAGFTGFDRQLLEQPMLVGGPGATPARAAAFALRAFSVGELAEAAGPGVLAAATAALEDLYAGVATDEGVPMDAAVWLLSARRQ